MARYNVDLQDNEGNAYQIMANPDSVAEFSPAANRENIRSGETYRVIFGKIMKYLSEVGNAAYVGLANNCTTTIAGFALDARQGKELMDRINELNRDLSAMNDNGAITGMDAREDGVYITYVPADGADPVSKKLCDPDIKKHKITGKTFSVKASEISASKILGVGIEKFSYSVGVDNANWSYGCSISSSYSDDSASGSVSATWGGPAGAGNYNISATWIVYYLG